MLHPFCVLQNRFSNLLSYNSLHFCVVCSTQKRAEMRRDQFHSWLTVDAKGLYCRPGDFHIDPYGGAKRAVITHGHSDHARPGHEHVLATSETLAVMKTRLGTVATRGSQA